MGRVPSPAKFRKKKPEPEGPKGLLALVAQKIVGVGVFAFIFDLSRD